MQSKNNIEKVIESLLSATECLLMGKYDDAKIEVDSEGLISNLAQKINTMIINMRTVELPLVNANTYAPSALTRAESVITLMAQSTNDVLNTSDQLVETIEKLEKNMNSEDYKGEKLINYLHKELPVMKAGMFNIISSQSYHDVARQKMEALVDDLSNIRNWLIDALVILNIKKDSSESNMEKKVGLLKQVKNKTMAENARQDLVDDLLSEFGL
jgi:chemotaxis regulatin CheY-phosphate phosphatase CheZ